MSLKDQYEKMHLQGHFPGQMAWQFRDDILRLMKKTGAKTLLDYGSGKGKQWGKLALHLQVDPTLYDPYYPPNAKRPEGTFDGVICTDVLEHIPEDEVEQVLRDIIEYARCFVFLTICTKPAKKTLPDGRNAHLTVRPSEWWDEMLDRILSDYEPIVMAVRYT